MSTEIDGVNGILKIEDAGTGAGAKLNLTSTDTSGASGEFLGIINFVSSDSSTGSAGTQAAIKGVYEDNGDSSGLEFFTGNSTGSGTPTLQKRMQIFHDSGVTITTADNTDTLTLTSTDADAAVGPNLKLYRNSGSPADNDSLGQIFFVGRNDNSQDFTAFQMNAYSTDVSDGTEDGTFRMYAMQAGSQHIVMQITPTETVFNDGSVDQDFRVESNGNANMIFVDGGNDHVNIGGSSDLGGMLNVAGNGVFQNADQTDTLSLINTDADANVGPRLKFARNSGSPADGDVTGDIRFEAKDDGGNDFTQVTIVTTLEDATNGTEDAQLAFDVMLAGTLRERMSFGSAATVFNDDSVDVDFRVESNDFSHMLFVDAGLNEVMVGGNGEQAAHFSVQNGTTDERAQVITCTNASYTGIALDMGVSRNTTNGTYHFLKMQRRGFAFSLICTDGGTITTTNNSYGAISDQRLKSNITDASSQWDDIKALKVRNYKMLQDPDQTTQIGVISQELETAGMNGLINESVADEYQIAYVDDESVLKAGDKVKEVKYSVLYMKAIKALQEAQTRIETLETKVAALEG